MLLSHFEVVHLVRSQFLMNFRQRKQVDREDKYVLSPCPRATIWASGLISRPMQSQKWEIDSRTHVMARGHER